MLKLSKKWSYAVKAMIFIAESQDDLVHISDISEKENISLWMLRRIISDLEKKGVVKTIKWRNWWIMLWKEISKISTYEILSSVWEELGITECTRWEDCSNHDSCSTTSLFHSLQTWFNSLLKMYTLDKIIKSERK